MTIERSHGKARPTLPRSSDLSPVPATDDRRSGLRDGKGRWVTGNGAAIGRGEKLPIRRALGAVAHATDAEVRAVAADAARLFAATIAEMPSDGSAVRQLVALQCRAFACAAFWTAKAEAEGLSSEEGIAASDQAVKHGQRAERLSVTALDVATKLAAGKKGKGAHLSHLDALFEAPKGGK